MARVLQQYNAGEVPVEYQKGWLQDELRKLQRAIPAKDNPLLWSMLPVGSGTWDLGGAAFTALLNGNLRVANAALFPGVATTASAANAFLDNAANNNLLRSTSSVRYKTALTRMSIRDAREFVMGLDPSWYRSRSPADDPDDVWPGLTAERAAALDDAYVTYDAQGRPDWVMYDRITVPLVAVAQDHEQRIAQLEQTFKRSRGG